MAYEVVFSATAADAFAELPEPTKVLAASCIELLQNNPRMYPVRQRGIFRGYRYFVAGRHLFYYRLSSEQVLILAILPGMMRNA